MRRFSITLDHLLQNLSNTGRGSKQAVGIAADASISVLALWLGYSVRFSTPYTDLDHTWYVFLIVPLVTVATFAALGVYRWVVRSSNRRLYRQLIKGCLLSALVFVLLTYFAPPERNPRSLFGLYGLLLIAGTCGLRLIWQGLFDVGRRGEPVAIFGAGQAGRQLVSLLEQSERYRPVAFIDDERALRGSTVSGLPVFRRDGELKATLRSLDVGRLVIAMPSLNNADYRRTFERLAPLELPVQTMPTVNELVSGVAEADEIRDISINDLLGRAEVAPDAELIGRRVRGRTVLVTGGGGSIGSELCRQIARLEPARLIVLDNCEANLYHITEELAREDVDFVPRLVSATDRPRLERLMAEQRIDTVYHAAAYKHVPIVEAQPEQGVETNVFGTLGVLESALAAGVADFVLISTDKAVRPANSMGATKRVAEMALQAKAAELAAAAGTGRPRTRLSMVRFGNVLGSSGSVVPKFKKQIEAGGPITVTHPEITRFFMTIPEAAQLVLQASAIATGGEVFVLDMGEPVKIVDLARTMVRLYGKRLRSETGHWADIAIEFEGLRPGEKMYEELFITHEHRPTDVPKVFTADESWLEWPALRQRLDLLADAASRDDSRAVRAELMRLALGEDFPPSMGETREDERTAESLC